MSVWGKTYSQAAMKGKKTGEPQNLLERLAALEKHAQIQSPELSEILKSFEQAVLNGRSFASINVEKYLLSMEHVVDQVSSLEEKMRRLNKQMEDLMDEIKDLKDERAAREYVAEFADYCSITINDIIYQYEASGGDWDVLNGKLGKERRHVEHQAQKGLLDTDICSALYRMDNHKAFSGVFIALGWTIEEYEQLFKFRNDRNDSSHSGYINNKDKQSRVTILTSSLYKLLDHEKVPSPIKPYCSTLQKAVTVLLSSENQSSIVH